MANLFRLLGLPDPTKVSGSGISKRGVTVDPEPQAEDIFHYLDERGSEASGIPQAGYPP